MEIRAEKHTEFKDDRDIRVDELNVPIKISRHNRLLTPSL